MTNGARRAAGGVAAALAMAVLGVASTAIVEPGAFSPWNPALGVGAGLVLAVGAWTGAPVVLGALAAAWWLGWATPIGVGPGLAVASGAAPVLVGLAARRLMPPDPAAWSVREVVVVIFTALGAGLALGAVTLARAAAAALGGPSPADHFPVVVGGAIGIAVGLPAVASLVALARGGARVRAGGVPVADLAMQGVFTLVVGAAGYTLRGPTGERFWSLYFLPLLWTAFRFGMHGVVAAQVLIGAQAIVLAMVLRTPYSVLTNYHFFLFNFTATALLLAAALGARQAAERAKGRSEALLSGAFRVTDDPLVLFHRADGEMLDVNDAWARLVGRPRDRLVGRSLYALDGWERDAGAALRALVQQGDPVREFSAEFRQPCGALRAIVAVVEMVTVDAEAFGVAFIRDVTEARLIERARLQSQKLEAVGLLAGGVAHDFNNILTVITASGALLRESVAPDDPRLVEVDGILDAARRGADLTRQLLAFSRDRPDAPPRAVDATAVIEGMTTMLARLLGAQIRIVTRLQPGVTVHAAPGQLEQVVLNLAVNARDAMAGRGTLDVEVAERVLSEGAFEPEVGASVAAGTWAVIRVRDTGGGIDPAIVARIFEPFFTTKLEGGGTGLGLSTVYGITRSVGGHVGVRSVVGEGTAFVLYWPDGARPAAD